MNPSHNRLYIDSHWISPYAFSAFVALTEKSVPFEVVELAFDKKEQLQDGYPKQSFTGRIPAYVEDNFWLAESSAIVEYVEEKYAAPMHPRLLPTKIEDRARARMVMAFIRSDLGALREERPTTTMFYARAATPLTVAGQAAATKLLRFTQEILPPNSTSLFEQWSIADADLAFMLQRLLLNAHDVPLPIQKFVEHQWQRPSVRTFVEHKRRPFTPYSY